MKPGHKKNRGPGGVVAADPSGPAPPAKKAMRRRLSRAAHSPPLTVTSPSRSSDTSKWSLPDVWLASTCRSAGMPMLIS